MIETNQDIQLNNLTFKANGDILHKGRKLKNDVTIVNALRKNLGLPEVKHLNIIPYNTEFTEDDTIYKAKFKSSDGKRRYHTEVILNELADNPKSEPIHFKCECDSFNIGQAENKNFKCKHINYLIEVI